MLSPKSILVWDLEDLYVLGLVIPKGNSWRNRKISDVIRDWTLQGTGMIFYLATTRVATKIMIGNQDLAV